MDRVAKIPILQYLEIDWLHESHDFGETLVGKWLQVDPRRNLLGATKAHRDNFEDCFVWRSREAVQADLVALSHQYFHDD